MDIKTSDRKLPDGPAILPVPVTIGFISTLMGIGGGSLTVPVLTYYGVAIHRAVGTSALFGMLIAIPATIGFMVTGFGNDLLPVGNIGFVSLIGLAFIAPASVLAAPLGARLAHRMNQGQLSMIFGIGLLVVAVRMFFRALQV